MINKQQKYIEENDIGGDLATEEKSIYILFNLIDADLFLEGPDLEIEDQDVDDEYINYISDFNDHNKLPQQPIADNANS